MRPSSSLQAYKKVGYLQRKHSAFPLSESLSTALLGRTHRHTPLGLPPASPPLYPQQVILADGSSFTHWTTSPRSVYKLTKDLSNHPLWYPNRTASRDLQDEFGRIGKFRTKYSGFSEEDEGSSAFVGELEDWMSEGAVEQKEKLKKVRFLSPSSSSPLAPLPGPFTLTVALVAWCLPGRRWKHRQREERARARSRPASLSPRLRLSLLCLFTPRSALPFLKGTSAKSPTDTRFSFCSKPFSQSASFCSSLTFPYSTLPGSPGQWNTHDDPPPLSLKRANPLPPSFPSSQCARYSAIICRDCKLSGRVPLQPKGGRWTAARRTEVQQGLIREERVPPPHPNRAKA